MSRAVRASVPLAAFAALLLATSPAAAQGGRPRPPPQPPAPQQGGGDDGAGSSGVTSGEPTAAPPEDPLALPEGLEGRIGSDYDGRPPAAAGELDRRYFPLYQEQRGDYRLRLLPPLHLEHTRGLGTFTKDGKDASDTESLTGLLYYRRRSPERDRDVLFPLAWRVRNGDDHVLALGPVVHREAPFEHDNWLAPLFFEGERKTGGYLHVPWLLTTSRWSDKSAFTISGPYFRDRTGSDVDWGVFPFVFRGNNGDQDGAARTYTLVPPALFYDRYRELDQSRLTVVGPLLRREDPKRSITDVLPLVFSITGKPETGGVAESHLTVFPFFHYGHAEDPAKNERRSLLVVPGLLRRTTSTVSTTLTPLVSWSTTRSGATRTFAAGPVVPLVYAHKDIDVGARALGLFPLFYHQHDPTGTRTWTPLFGRFEDYAVSRTWWLFPTLVVSKDTRGWETDLHPILYFGRDKDRSHNVVAPLFWDFASKNGRTTIGFPLYWRFSDTNDRTLTQVALNTLYREKPAIESDTGTDWQFHFLPLLSFGKKPTGHFWNVLFGLAGYERDGATAKVKALWVPIKVAGPPPQDEAMRR